VEFGNFGHLSPFNGARIARAMLQVYCNPRCIIFMCMLIFVFLQHECLYWDRVLSFVCGGVRYCTVVPGLVRLNDVGKV
jgi:hypothetical protein